MKKKRYVAHYSLQLTMCTAPRYWITTDSSASEFRGELWYEVDGWWLAGSADDADLWGK